MKAFIEIVSKDFLVKRYEVVIPEDAKFLEVGFGTKERYKFAISKKTVKKRQWLYKIHGELKLSEGHYKDREEFIRSKPETAVPLYPIDESTIEVVE